ncbi:amino acid adenylation domain-containing protein [Streptomyces sp. NPDC056486]|uniref:non-ribosomal peptide synthetase n=1 Tax=Streptomyces sp. NPDC056486 TaxID=3345835 RepID=UPI00369039CA
MALAPFSAEQQKLLDQLLDGQGVARRSSAIERRPDPAAPAPLSYAQERLHFFDRMRPGSPLYSMTGLVRLRGAVDVTALEGALGDVVARHEVLRTVFRSDQDGTVHQVVRPATPVTLPVTEVPDGGEDTDAGEDAVRERVRQENERGFDLAEGPLLRGSLIRLGDTEWVLVLCVHHIVVDGWSLGVLVDELAETYAARVANRPDELPELPVQYADFALWQRDWLSGERLERQLAYWRGQLDGATAPEVPGDRPRPAVDSFAGDSVRVEVPAPVVAGLTRLVEDESATLFMGLLGAFSAVLGRWSGRGDVVVGTAVAGRTRTELEPLVGFFVNTLALRVDVGGGASFREVVRRARQTALDGFAHQDLPFERIVQELSPERHSSGRIPFVNHMLVLHNTPYPEVRLPEVTFEVVPQHTGTAKFDLELELTLTAEGSLAGALEFSSELYDRSTAERLVEGVVALLSAAVENPDAPVDLLDVMGREQDARIREFSGLGAAPFAPALLHELIERRVDVDPAAVAVCGDGVGEAGNWSYSYGELDERANRFAWWLRERGVGAESLVGVCLERGRDLIPVLLGVLKAGAAYLPLDPSYPADRIGQLVADGRPALVLTSAGADAVLAGMAATDADIVVRVEDIADDLAQRPTTRPAVTVDPRNPAYVLFTSGSTGRPKGAANSHHAITNRLLWMQDRYRLDATDRVLHKTPIGFDVSVWELTWALLTGARIVLADPGGQRDPEYLARATAAAGITTAHFVPSMLKVFLDTAEALGTTGAVGAALPELRRVVCSGEELTPEVAARFQALFPHAELHNLYGPTEASIDVTAHHVTAPVTGRVPIGTPITGARIHILDAALRMQPIGVAGELCIGGVPLARGYHGRPGLTADRFVPDPFEAGERLYRTGDLVRRRADGAVEYLGRLDNQIKIRGQRIEPAEVEAALLDHHAVDQALVTTAPDADGTPQLVAYLTKSAKPAAAGHDAQVDRWSEVFDQIYRAGEQQTADPTFDISGWISSYTGEPLGADEMHGWVDSIVDRVLALPHRRVLEIGCGTGLLLFPIAPHTEYYRAVDVSEVAVRDLADKLRLLPPGSGEVELVHGSAEQFDGVEDNSFDTVLINSVAQYFPNADYLADVLTRALRVVRPGGAVIVGDVRNHALLDTFHASLQRTDADGEESEEGEEFERAVADRVAQDAELVIDPHFFTALAGDRPEIEGVSLLAKRGHHRNELVKYRYDAVLHLADEHDEHDEHTAAQSAPPADAPVTWPAAPVADLAARLDAERPESVLIPAVADQRLAADLEAARGGTALDPAELAVAVADFGYEVVPALHPERPGHLDVLLTRSARRALRPVRDLPLRAPDRGWAAYSNNPMEAAWRSSLVPELRAHLQDRLPESMVPRHFLVLDAWPLSANGKLDRKALPEPSAGRDATTAVYVAPRTPTERAVVTVWSDVLGVSRVGALDNFFELGGHSLLATRVTARLADACGTEVRLGAFFQHPTVAALAAHIDEEATRQVTVRAPVRRADRSRYRGTRQAPAATPVPTEATA